MLAYQRLIWLIPPFMLYPPPMLYGGSERTVFDTQIETGYGAKILKKIYKQSGAADPQLYSDIQRLRQLEKTNLMSKETMDLGFSVAQRLA